MNKKIIGLVIGGVVLAGISFYAGNQYANSKNQAVLSQNPASAMRGSFTGQRGGRTGGGGASGKIIAKDTTSITVELNSFGQNGGTAPASGTQVSQGSKIVFYTNKTSVIKTIDGKVSDLVVGEQISVNGTANTDGSISAQSIQIRPAMPKPAGQ